MNPPSVVVLALLVGIGVSTLACGGSAPSSETATPATMEEATPAAATSPTPAPTAAQEQSLYDRLGGVSNIAAVVDDFIERLLVNDTLNANAAINEARARVPKAGLKFQAPVLVCQVTDGPCTYMGRDMKTAHAHLNISENGWAAMVVDFLKTLNAFEVPTKEQEELIAIVATTREDIVTVR